MPDGGLITPVLKSADSTDIYQLSRNWAVGLSSNTMQKLEASGLAVRRQFDDMLDWGRSSSTAHSFVCTSSMAGIARTIPKVQLGQNSATVQQRRAVVRNTALPTLSAGLNLNLWKPTTL